jgi:hypothetical protein
MGATDAVASFFAAAGVVVTTFWDGLKKSSMSLKWSLPFKMSTTANMIKAVKLIAPHGFDKKSRIEFTMQN